MDKLDEISMSAKYFLGSDKIFEDVRVEISLPILRKDFTVDQAKKWLNFGRENRRFSDYKNFGSTR